ncbi:MAG: DEAD/DEAH box helicase [Anaerolineaceae bacterium]|nr:DEAD/DEAH box helicase [Anaerolineaceae bacterium]
MDLSRFLETLHKTDALRSDDEIRSKVVENVRPRSASQWPLELDFGVRDTLINEVNSTPYQHQADAIRKSLQGSDVVLESPTASGKTVAFAAPMLHTLVNNPDSHALMIYPMKALAFDQREQLRPLCDPLGIESWPYDGDAPKKDRDALRSQPPQILLTNPEYLNMTFLGWKEQWSEFLRKLEFVVIDEMHEYRGFFGSNMALLLRRFFLQLDRLNNSPRVFLSTATCANPEEHARKLTGRDVELISAPDVLRPKRHFLFVNPDIPDHQYWKILQLRIENAAMAILEQDMQALVFCPTKRFLEDAFRLCQKKVAELGFNPDLLAAFHADLHNETRQGIQQRIKSGEIRVVFATNALELGLDIGGLDGVVLAGFPSNIMSAWQQIGRAGRGWDRDAFVLFYAMNDPIDRFFVSNIDAFLDKRLDQLVIDPNNEKLIDNHLGCLVQETDGLLKPSDAQILGNGFHRMASKEGGQPIRGYRPQPSLRLRGDLGRSYELKQGNKELGRISETRRFREAYIGAVFTFYGRKYRVHSYEEHAVQLTDVEPNLRTDPGFYPNLYRGEIFCGLAYERFQIFHGTLNFSTTFTGYKLVDERSGDVLGSEQADLSQNQYNLHAVWFNMLDSNQSLAGLGALEHLFRVGALFVIPTDRFDTSTWSNIKNGPTAYYYENYEGGIGVARKLYEVWPEVLSRGIEIAANCSSCRRGCQNCIEPAKSWSMSNSPIDKEQGIHLAESLLEAERKGIRGEFRNGRMIEM